MSLINTFVVYSDRYPKRVGGASRRQLFLGFVFYAQFSKTSQQQLVTVSRQARELSDLEGQASRLNKNLAANKLKVGLGAL